MAQDSDPTKAPVPGWTAELGEGQTVVLRHAEAPPIVLEQEAAGRLGLSMLATSVVLAGPPQRPPVGTTIENVHFPLTAWQVGRSKVNGHPVLIVAVPGGREIMLQFTGSAAHACGQALVNETRSERLAAGQKPN